MSQTRVPATEVGGEPSAKPYRPGGDGLILAVRLTPRAAQNRIEGIRADVDGAPVLQLRVKAPPVEGAANKALIALVAERLGLRQGDVAIRSGERSRTKILDLSGDAARLAVRLEAWLASG